VRALVVNLIGSRSVAAAVFGLIRSRRALAAMGRDRDRRLCRLLLGFALKRRDPPTFRLIVGNPAFSAWSSPTASTPSSPMR
jgi:hypothetical protein